MAHSYANAYALVCQSTVETLQARLGREVSPQERRCIWNVGSLMMLECVERTCLEGSIADIEGELRIMPRWTEKRFQAMVTGMLEHFPRWLGRPATERERQMLERMEHVGALLSFEEWLTSAPPDQREAIVRDALSLLVGGRSDR